MRNGNLKRFEKHFARVVSSYRTYEEWKPPLIRTKCLQQWPSSYRTYEEWKLAKVYEHLGYQISSYRTYEEWKPLRLSIDGHRISWVLTVPMRNGNAIA